MNMTPIVYIVVLAVALCVDYLIAREFERIAGEKGYTGYFWWCFLLGFVGYIMVAALPDRNAPNRAE